MFSCTKLFSCIKIIQLKNVSKFLYKTTFKLENQVEKVCKLRGGVKGSSVSKSALLCRIIEPFM